MIRSSGPIVMQRVDLRAGSRRCCAWVSITPLGRLVVPLEYGQHGDVLGRRRPCTSGTGPVRGEQLLHAAVALDLVAGRRSPVAGASTAAVATGSSAPTVTTSVALLSSSWLAMSLAVVSALTAW